MLKLFRYISCLSFLLQLGWASYAQSELIHEQLSRYETMCRQCLNMKSSAASGKYVSRQQAKTLIDGFLELNKALKSRETEMTASQRNRFASVGEWFSTGTLPEPMPCDMPLPEILPPFDAVCVAVLYNGVLKNIPYRLTKSDCDSLSGSSLGLGKVIRNHRGDIFLLATLAAPDLSYGLMAGYQHKRWGGYLNFRSNYIFGGTSYTCDSDGIMDDGNRFWPSGNDRVSVLHASVGGLASVMDWLTIYAGTGYGYRRLAWEDVDGNWVRVSDWSHSGTVAECGAILSIRKIAFSVGLSTVSFRTAAFTCGVGVRF